jgi:hypothetical protein
MLSIGRRPTYAKLIATDKPRTHHVTSLSLEILLETLDSDTYKTRRLKQPQDKRIEDAEKDLGNNHPLTSTFDIATC